MARIEGRGNGIKTNVVNNAEIAKALERPPDCACAGCRGGRVLSGIRRCGSAAARARRCCAPLHLSRNHPSTNQPHPPHLRPHPLPPPTADCLKYYGFELGAMVNYDKKSGNSIVNGAHDAGRLSELLEGFIKK